MKKPKQHTAVINLRTGIFTPFKQGFATENEATAAAALIPGTQYGQGWTETEAKAQAAERREWHLKQGY